MDYIGHYLLAGVLFAVIDSLWIGLVANKFYKQQLGSLLLDKPNFIPAVIFYLISILSMVVFVIEPGLDGKTTAWVIIHGALLGLASYATYDLTNASTLKNWPRLMTLVDMAWGTVVTAAVTTVAFLILG